MEIDRIQNNVLKILLYYDIFNHPLKKEEIYTFLPENTVSRHEINNAIDKLSGIDKCYFAQKDGYVYIKPNSHNIKIRKEKEEYSKKIWRVTKYVTHLIKRFPFVRAIMVTGSLSKNSSSKISDIDFMIITKKNRLWVARMVLMLFKKIFLLNSYKFFCINYFITEDLLEIEDKNIFSATEIVTIKGTFNTELMNKFLISNQWVNRYFPNYIVGDENLHSPGFKVNNRRSYLQGVLELFFYGFIGDYINKRFRKITTRHWEKKYCQMEEKDRNQRFRSTDKVSKTHPEGMQKQILTKYNEKLKLYNLM